jgi:hypothetical protein
MPAYGTLTRGTERPTSGAGRRWLKPVGLTVGGMIGVLVAAVIAYSSATAPPSLPGRTPLTAFDPQTVGRLEQRAWQAYYLRQWPQLFDVMLRMIRSTFGLSLHEAVYAAYINTRAQMTWARQGESDGTAEAYMREFYAYVREPVGGRYDSARAAQLEVRWWAVHRNRDQYPDHSALAQAPTPTPRSTSCRPSGCCRPARPGPPRWTSPISGSATARTRTARCWRRSPDCWCRATSPSPTPSAADRGASGQPSAVSAVPRPRAPLPERLS